MTPNRRPILYTAHVRRPRPARSELVLTVAICAVWALLFLGIVGYMDLADERAASPTSGPPRWQRGARDEPDNGRGARRL